jgi:hypothetical protein
MWKCVYEFLILVSIMSSLTITPDSTRPLTAQQSAHGDGKILWILHYSYLLLSIYAERLFQIRIWAPEYIGV